MDSSLSILKFSFLLPQAVVVSWRIKVEHSRGGVCETSEESVGSSGWIGGGSKVGRTQLGERERKGSDRSLRWLVGFQVPQGRLQVHLTRVGA